MKPYYQDSAVTIYHGDCLELLPLLRGDVVVTDPPYGISWKRGVNHARGSKAHEGIQNDHDTTARDEALALVPEIPGVVFGSFYAPPPERLKQTLVWAKPADAGVVGSVTGFRRDAEPVFLVGPWPQRTVDMEFRSPFVGRNCGSNDSNRTSAHKASCFDAWLNS